MKPKMRCLLPHKALQPTLKAPLSTAIRTFHSPPKPHSSADETSIATAKHKPSLSGPSLGHLLTELSATTPEMVKAGSRKEGQTKVTIGVLGLPLALGSVVVGATWFWSTASKGED